ncbi:MAG: amylo-alpha-1,6-glucosidase [Limisphaerales bacterium]
MSPRPADRLVRFVGDSVRFTLRGTPDASGPAGWKARLRTTLGRATTVREEIIQAHVSQVPAFGARWHDVPLDWNGSEWTRDFLLAETGFAHAKAYLIDPAGLQHWPEGPDAGISVHPNWTRTGNTVYCAFTRLFGPTRAAHRLLPEPVESSLRHLEAQGYATLPASGTLRDLARLLPHVVQRLGCRILHLLPVHPTPTTFARYGRMGSPYAALDLTAIDPALVEFDHRTTGIQQFEELTRAARRLGARVFLDIVINHTGWGSRLFEEHPEYFRRDSSGNFASPGAWGVTWEDLVELEPHDVALWDLLAEALLAWCRRGVDGFRCDAGYKIPTHVWQYICARIRAEFPDAVLLLEGLGGSWDATEDLLTEGGMQWAYSELFQNFSGDQVQGYLDYALRQSTRVGTYVHYSETHDNDRLAARGREWSLLRNRLCALTSVQGGFGFTCGVEWLATEKILVHQRTGLAWDSPVHLVDELAALNQLLLRHPAFFDGATLTRLSPEGCPAFALLRRSADLRWTALVLVNLDPGQTNRLDLPNTDLGLPPTAFTIDLLGQPLPESESRHGRTVFTLAPGSAYSLSDQPAPPVEFGEEYRARRARVAWALQAACQLAPAESVTGLDAEATSRLVAENGPRWLALLSEIAARRPSGGIERLDLGSIARAWTTTDPFPCVMIWSLDQARRITVVPPGWWLVVVHPTPFQAHLRLHEAQPEIHRESIPVAQGHLTAFPPATPSRSLPATLRLDAPDAKSPVVAPVQFLADPHDGQGDGDDGNVGSPVPDPDGVVLLTNRRGGMSRVRIHLGSVRSKYDAVLAANLHPSVPVDRHVFVKRVRAWLNADGFISPLDGLNLVRFESEPVPSWTFKANAGDGRSVVIALQLAMLPDRNTVVFRFTRSATGAPLDASLTLRVDVEDRSFHAETRRNPGAEDHFNRHCRPIHWACGFEFTPAHDRRLVVSASSGTFNPQPEWSEHIPHPIEASRGQVGEGDAYSPGWFSVPLAQGASVTLTLDAEPPPLAADGNDPSVPGISDARKVTASPAPVPVGNVPTPAFPVDPQPTRHPVSSTSALARQLARATDAYVVRRDAGHTVVAGYPWFLDWGRDTLIAARGLLASGWDVEVDGILRVFGRFADRGTLPNSIHGDNASNRDTSDAALWFVRVVEEIVDRRPQGFLLQPVHPGGPSLLNIVRDLLDGHLRGTPNGIRVDPDSGLVWSPSHFTWMDTNHPAGTPREGYPVEIQALWITALRFVSRMDSGDARWKEIEQRASASFSRLFWLEDRGWFSDVLLARPQVPAAQAVPDTALRCNTLLPVTLGLATESQARRCVDSAIRHLLVPGALRSLAPLPVSPPLPIQAPDGRLLNDPDRPYRGQYQGDEDTQRKPAYHNGTAWTWFLPTFCEALAVAWNQRPEARRAARAILATTADLLPSGCIGQLPEILDGDAPHSQRGCDAQAWSVTESLRVWLSLEDSRPERAQTQ